MESQEAYTIGSEWLSKHPVPKFKDSVMFDIDDTLLLVEWGSNELTLSPNTPIIKLLLDFHKAGYLIYIITARDFRGRNQTMDELKEYNIPYHELHMRYPYSGQHFKSVLKEIITKRGNRFVMSVGDQPIDVEGEYSGLKLKLKSRLLETQAAHIIR
jgi:predicted secreted acid phosphatase